MTDSRRNPGPVHVVRSGAHALDVTSASQKLRDFILHPGRGKKRDPLHSPPSWSDLLQYLSDRPAACAAANGRECVVELEPGTQDAATKSIVRAIGALLYKAGATSVTCHGRVITRPAEQAELFSSKGAA